jgi:hypothetical protein
MVFSFKYLQGPSRRAGRYGGTEGHVSLRGREARLMVRGRAASFETSVGQDLASRSGWKAVANVLSNICTAIH